MNQHPLPNDINDHQLTPEIFQTAINKFAINPNGCEQISFWTVRRCFASFHDLPQDVLDNIKNQCTIENPLYQNCMLVHPNCPCGAKHLYRLVFTISPGNEPWNGGVLMNIHEDAKHILCTTGEHDIVF